MGRVGHWNLKKEEESISIGAALAPFRVLWNI